MMARPSEAELRRGEAPAWGARSGRTAPRPRKRLVSWKPITKGSLRGFATVELPIGLKLDCAVFVGINGAWARPPAKPQLDKDGRQRNHCFACGAHGEVIEFLRRYDNPDCGSAVVKLASALAAAIREQRSVIAAFATAGGPS
jgi:CHC2 zinc finger